MATARKIQDVMTRQPAAFPASAPVSDAARAMRDTNTGCVLVTLSGELCGIVTDRDIAVRAVAEGKDPQSTPLGEICSRELNSLSPTDGLDMAVNLMKEKAIRRIPVVENGKALGVVSLGDLAERLDPASVLGQISIASANH